MKHSTKIVPVAAVALGALLVGCNSTASSTDTSNGLPVNSDSDSVMSSAPGGAMMDDQEQDDGMMQSSSAPVMNSSAPSAMEKGSYKDGTYSAVGVYRSPAGGEQVDVTLTLANGVVTDATFTGEATNPKSVAYQDNFAKGFKEEVVGKSIDSLSLTVVNGSSLTPMGFMDAVAKIKAEAKA